MGKKIIQLTRDRDLDALKAQEEKQGSLGYESIVDGSDSHPSGNDADSTLSLNPRSKCRNFAWNPVNCLLNWRRGTDDISRLNLTGIHQQSKNQARRKAYRAIAMDL